MAKRSSSSGAGARRSKGRVPRNKGRSDPALARTVVSSKSQKPAGLRRAASRPRSQKGNTSAFQVVGIIIAVVVGFAAIYSMAWMAGMGSEKRSSQRRARAAGEELGQQDPLRRRPQQRSNSAEAAETERKQGITQLEREMLRISAFAQKNPGKMNAILARWHAFSVKAEGTSLHDYAAGLIAELEGRKAELGDRTFRHVQRKIRPLARSGYWPAALSTIDHFVEQFSGTPAALRMQNERPIVLGMKKQAQSATIRVFADFQAAQPKFSPMVRITVRQQIRQDGHHLSFLANNASQIEFTFQIPQLPKRVYLRVGHLMSLSSAGSYSPITIRINGKILLGDWSPFSINFYTSRWEISRYLQVGQNRISWQLGEARTMYWLRRWEVSDWED